MSILNKISSSFFACLLLGGISFNCGSSIDNRAIEKDVLTLTDKIDLPNVSGRIDHIAYDTANHVAFIAALGNNTVEVVNIDAKQVVHTIKGLHEPQGILYLSSLKRLVVANGGNGSCIFYDSKTFAQLSSVDLKSDADNIRYDESSGLLYVGYGDGGIAVLNPNTMKQVANIPLDGHPESFQLDTKQSWLYINVPDEDEIAVADLSTSTIMIKWKNTTASSNFPMAYDEINSRVFIGCRSPSKLRMINTQTGKDIAALTCTGDADDVFYNDDKGYVYVSGGKGFIDIFKATDENELKHINHIETSSGARTSLLLASKKQLLLAVPAHSGNPAALWVYTVN